MPLNKTREGQRERERTCGREEMKWELSVSIQGKGKTEVVDTA